MYLYSTTPSAGTLQGSSMLMMTSGLPIFQPSVNCGAGGRSLVSPSFMPPSTHETRVATSLSDRRRSFENVPGGALACHGGIGREATFSLIDLPHGRTSL